MVKTQLVDINEGRDISFFAPFASIALVWLMLALRDIAGVNVNRYIILAVCAVGMFLSNMHGANCIVFAMLPLMSGIPSTYIFIMYTCIRIIKRASFKAISVFMAISLRFAKNGDVNISSNMSSNKLVVLGKNFILIASIFKHPHGCLQAAVHGILSIGASPDYTYHYSHIFSTVKC